MDEGRELGQDQSSPLADNAATSGASKRPKIASAKARENSDGSAASKTSLMRDSDALLTLVGEIIHGDPDLWGILLTKQHGKGSIQSRFAKHLTQYDHPLTLNKKEPTSETISNWIKRGLAVAEEESKNRGENAGRRSAPITELAKTWYELVDFYKQYASQQEKTDRYTTVPDHLKGTGVELQYDDHAALPSGRAEKAAGSRMREDAIAKVAEHRETGRQEKGSDNKDHVHPRRPPPPTAVQQSGTDSLLQSFVQTEAMRSKQEVVMKKTEQLNMYLTMLSNPNMPPESKGTITSLFNNLAKELKEQESGSGGGGGGDGSGGGGGGGGARTQVPAGALAPRRLNLGSAASAAARAASSAGGSAGGSPADRRPAGSSPAASSAGGSPASTAVSPRRSPRRPGSPASAAVSPRRSPRRHGAAPSN
jgi:hypothetical protein